MRRLVGILGLFLVAVIFVAGFMAYFVSSFDQTSHTWSDGLGRHLTKSPAVVGWLFDQREWPGLSWFLADLLIFWGGGAIAVVAMRWGFKAD